MTVILVTVVLCLLMFLCGVAVALWVARSETMAARDLASRTSSWQEHAFRMESLARETKAEVVKVDETLGRMSEILKMVVRATVPKELRTLPTETGAPMPQGPSQEWQNPIPLPPASQPATSRPKPASLPAQS